MGNLVRGAWRRLSGAAQGFPVWGPRYQGIQADAATLDPLTLAARQWCASVQRARRELSAIDPARVHEIRYEALVQDEQALGPLCAFLGLADPEPVLAAYRARVRRDAGGGWERLGADEQARLLDQLTPELARLGYAGAADGWVGQANQEATPS